MARLLVQTDGIENRPINLRLGTNCVGRSADCDFQINHSTISSKHCEFVLSADGILLRDCDSTNGTFVDGQPVKEALLQAGQMVHLGEVKFLVENTEITIAIPKFQKPSTVPVGVGSPVVMPAGALICPRHMDSLATYKCLQCSEVMCSKCVRSVKRQGGVAIFLCVVCGGKCQRVNNEPPRKKTFMDTLRRTVKLPFEVLSGRSTPPK